MSNGIESKTSLEGRNHYLDVVKLLASMAVVVIHVTGNTTGDKYYKPIWDLAVPCFYMISGYLVGHRSQEYITRYIKSIAKLFFSASLIYWVMDYLLFVMAKGFTNSIGLYYQANILPRLNWVYVLSGEIGKYHLWYLWASVIGFIIFKVLKKMDVPDWFMVVLGFVGYLGYLNNPIKYITYGGFPKAYLFIALGYLLKQRTTLKFNNKRFWVLPLILGLATTLPIIRMRATIPFMVEMMVVLTSTAIMYLAVTTYFPSNKLTKWSRNYTDKIYLYHPYALNILVLAAKFLDGEGWKKTGGLGTLILFVLTYTLTVFLVYLNNKLKERVRGLNT